MASFYDWVTCRFPLSTPHEINGGHIVTFNEHGEKVLTLDLSLKVLGSYASGVQVRTRGSTLEISGNPTKWLQGHNVFGSDNIRGLLVKLGQEVCEKLELPIVEHDLRVWRAGAVQLSRLDVKRMYRFPSGMVPGWLSVASAAARGGHQRVTNRGAFEGNTLYVGQHSRRISLKLYDKAAELKKHPIGDIIASEYRDKLALWASDTLRVEVTIRGMELKDRLMHHAAVWTPELADAVLDERIGKLSMLDNLTLADDVVEAIPKRLLPVYEMWRSGHDLSVVYSRAQFYKHRAALKEHGIDIATVRPRVLHPVNEYAMGRPMKDFLTGGGLEAPDWAVGTPLLACS